LEWVLTSVWRSMRRRLRSQVAPRLIRDRRLLLIDDVLTTGSTADEAARTLLDSGAREVSLLTISRANYRANSLI
jgi:predicted amidophosphoribosyltransferase